ncbi:MAG TPA: 3-hydroxyacyl-CoA dehydrogenase NAD-binding domain-containing protein [Candidatus Udaeobacter sp.]|nr:3-hydroxyacyl-CoA dehydrogenase NAD-binding domain-containing protein [Candidatus Udaeobacter sp.]
MTTTELSKTVSLERRGDIALLWTDNPPVNAISHSVKAGLHKGMAEIARDPAIKAGIVICRGSSFFSGADITEFGKEEQPPSWLDFDRSLDLSEKPVVAAIHTRAFGGGLEVALACHYRVADKAVVFAFPEVGLGIIPGGGGTQRFPRVAGFEAALDIIASARVFGTEEAEKLGVVDQVVEGKLEDAAIAFAKAIIAKGTKGKDLPRARNRRDAIAAAKANPQIFAKARETVKKRFRGFNGRLSAIDAIEKAVTLPFDEGFKAEVAIFDDCVKTAEHRALSHMFFAEREARRVPDLPKGLAGRKVTNVAVVGGGTMGRGITLAFADRGFPVRLIEANPEARDKALAYCRKEIEAGLAKGRMSEAEAKARIARITGGTGLQDTAGADLVIEAVFEDMALKKKVFAALDGIVAKGAILASNTSNLDIDEIAAVTKRPADVIGMHFFSPANIMKLLEIVRGEKTGADVLATALAVAKAINKQPVVARVCDGFLANRAFDTYWREAEFLVEEGASPYEVDKVLYDFGMPMGPFAVADLVGLDVGQLIRKRQRLKLPQGVRYSVIEDDIVALGKLGQKNGAGWYRYDANARSGTPDPAIEAVIDAYRRRRGFSPRRIAAEEIIERCIYAVINEAAKELEEGIAIRASDIDVASVYGMGFPAWRGGPMQYADEIGLKTVADTVERLHQFQGYWWEPSKLLLDLAKTGRKFGAD